MPTLRRPRLPHAAAALLVLGVHLWVIDAWSLPTAPTAAPGPVVVTSLAAAAPAPVVSVTPVEPAVMADPPVRPAQPTRPARTPPRPRQPIAPAPQPAPPRVTAAAVVPATAPAGDITADTTPALQLALAAPGAGPARPAIAAVSALTSPPSARLLYRLHKGVLVGTGQIDWWRDAGTYRMRLEARVPVLGQIFVETSDGRLDDGGLAPLRHTERRLKRSERAVSFVRDQGPPRILFSAREGGEPLNPGAQDRLSWIAQLAARLAAPPAGEWRAGERIEMDVASTGGDVQRWVFTVQGQDSDGLRHLRREPDSPHDTRAEVWTDPRQHHWPVRIRLSESSGDPLELTLDGLQPA